MLTTALPFQNAVKMTFSGSHEIRKFSLTHCHQQNLAGIKRNQAEKINSLRSNLYLGLVHFL